METFSTRDIVLAATIVCGGVKLESVDIRHDGTRQPVGWFNFPKEASSVEQEYLSGNWKKLM